MIRKIVVFVICLSFIGVATGLAEPLLKPREGIGEERFTWDVGTEAYYFKYEEPSLMDDKGIFYGVFGSLGRRFDSVLVRGEARYAYGKVDYTSGATGTYEGIPDYVFEFRGVVGYEQEMSKKTSFMPYIGLGHRYLNDGGEDRYTTTNNFLYERESTYLYSPIGVEMKTDLGNGWSVGLVLEFDYFWEGDQESHLGYKAGYYDIKNIQKGGYGARGSIRLVKRTPELDILFEPFVRFWDIEDSKTTTDPGGTRWLEPNNETMEIGAKLAAQF